MGGISTGGGGGGKKTVDHEIPLIPFIDLLLCCVIFLVMTAVWNKLARIDANQQQPGEETQDEPPPEEDDVKLVLQLQNSGFVLASTAGDRIEIPKKADDFDMEELRNKLQERKELEPNRTDIIVAPEDGVLYDTVVATMDTVVGEGFPDMSLSDGASML